MHPSSDQPAFRLQDGCKSFGGIEALANVALTIMPGTRLALIGPNGCGKTTLLNVVSGRLVLDKGDLRIAGRLITSTKPAWLARAGVGRTFQEGRVWGEMSVLDNIVIGMRWASGGLQFGRRKPTFDEQLLAHRLMGELELDPAIEHDLAGKLSLKIRRLVELARALAANPSILLVDEIAAGLNPVESRAVFRLLTGICGQRPKLALIVVEHKLDLLMNFAERVALMDSGRIVLDGPAGSVLTSATLLNHYWNPPKAKMGALH